MDDEEYAPVAEDELPPVLLFGADVKGISRL